MTKVGNAMKKIGGGYYKISFTTKIDGKEEEVKDWPISNLI